ncbi:primosomal replication protein PriC, partial [Alishewanella longhuensis]
MPGSARYSLGSKFLTNLYQRGHCHWFALPRGVARINSLTQTQINQLKALLQQLLEWAQQLDRKKKPGKPQHWFDSSLFSCHSPDLADYVLDSLRHLDHL